ncbi:NAD-binding Rossmann fold oxidoreductase family protein [Hortaea werneckii]|nr:NAD-binding Rossmann fold oxidoreductase family protein [Hortaea werneckii]
MSSPLSRRLKVGVVGLGRMGRAHAYNIVHSVPNATLVCACSPAPADLEWAQEALEPYDVKVVTSFEEMIEFPGLEAVIIASSTFLHAAQSIKALAKGIHVLCEKPVSKSIQEMEEVLAFAEAQPKATLMVAFVRRFDDNYREARAQLDRREIGRPIVIRSQQCERLDTSEPYKQYLADSGGIFVDSIIHDIDLALFLFGEDSKPKSVSAVGAAACHPQLTGIGDADNAVGICEFWHGKIAFFYNSRTTNYGYDNATEIFGTGGRLAINLNPRPNAIETIDAGGYVKIPAHSGWYQRYAPAFVNEAQAWVDAVLAGGEMPVPLRSSLTALKIAAALQESLRSGESIKFDQSGQIENPTKASL